MARESKAALTLVTDDAADMVDWVLRRTSGSFESRRLQLLDTVPDLIRYYSDGSAALAADFYDEDRLRADTDSVFRADLVVLDRTVKIRRGVAWAAGPLEQVEEDVAAARLAEIVRSEVVRPYRDTVLQNMKRDADAIGFRRYASGGACGFCRLLADKGAVYRESSAYFAAHDSCSCTAGPVFRGGVQGPPASALQYIASGRRRTPAEKARLRDAIAYYETSAP